MSQRSSIDVIQQMAPLLDSLGRLIVQGRNPGDTTLKTLLYALNLESDPLAQEEGKRWLALLKTLYQQPAPQLRRATAEALMRSAVPKDVVDRVVSTVAGPHAPPPPVEEVIAPPAHPVVEIVPRDEIKITLAPEVTLVLVRVPAGAFMMGCNSDDPLADPQEKPARRVHVDEYFIGKYPITVQQFQAFVELSGYTRPVRTIHPVKPDHPMIIERYEDALVFCRWASRMARRIIRLPTEAEWEKAARGTDERMWPWGNEPPTPERCNFGHKLLGDATTTTPVGRYSPQGDSPYGCVDMAGNVMEWTTSLCMLYPYRADDGRENPKKVGRRVLRGGSYISDIKQLRCTNRDVYYKNLSIKGFRICCSGMRSQK